MARKASTMSDSANIDLIIESSEDGAQSYKSDLVSIHIIKLSSLGTGGTGKPVHCTELCGGVCKSGGDLYMFIQASVWNHALLPRKSRNLQFREYTIGVFHCITSGSMNPLL